MVNSSNVCSFKRLFDSVVVRPPADDLIRCVSTSHERHSVNTLNALKQHVEYVKILLEEGIDVYSLPTLKGFPDAVFIQDTAIVSSLRREALISNFGEVSRRGEELSIAEFLGRHGYKLAYVKPPATLEGGDVLVTDVGLIYVGITTRTNLGGVEYLKNFYKGYEVIPVVVNKVFHLLSAVTYLGSKTVALVPELIDVSVFKGFKIIEVSLNEAYAVNMLYLGDGKVLMPEGYPKTYSKLRSNGFKPIEVDVSEFRKCDGGITCLSLPLYNV